MKYLYIAVFSSFLCSSSTSNLKTTENICHIMYPREGSQDWGIGAYFIPYSFHALVVQDSNRFEITKIHWGGLEFHMKKGERRSLNGFVHDGIGGYAKGILKVKEFTADGYAILLFSGPGDPIKISIREFERQGFKFYTYRELLLMKSDIDALDAYPTLLNVGVNLKNSCLNLRNAPSPKSSKIMCISSNDYSKAFHHHLEIVATAGQWFKVKVSIVHQGGICENLTMLFYWLARQKT